MTFRDILVQMDEKPTAKARAVAAANLARRLGATLSGVFMESRFVSDPMAVEALTYMAADDIDTLLREHVQATKSAAEAARVVFEAAAEGSTPLDWRTIAGDTDQQLIAGARRADLVVMPPVAEVSLSLYRIPAGDVAMSCGGPVLIVPDKGCPANFGKRVLVAWNGSREAARALRDAWPLLMAAEEVHVLIVSPDDDGSDGLLQRHLERHGCKAQVVVDRGEDVSAAKIIRAQIVARDIDLLVMGLFGHSRLQEIILGGVSRDILQSPPVATLVSH